jgi:hypothetical protein
VQVVQRTFDGNIVLGRPTDRAVTVNVLFNTDQESIYIEYGDTSGFAAPPDPASHTALRARVAYEELVAGLEPESALLLPDCVFVEPGRLPMVPTPEYTFHTQRATGSTFTFTLIADSHLFTTQHCDPARYALALQQCTR